MRWYGSVNMGTASTSRSARQSAAQCVKVSSTLTVLDLQADLIHVEQEVQGASPQTS